MQPLTSRNFQIQTRKKGTLTPNAGAQATAGHLGSVGAPTALTGLITAAPTLAAGYGVYKGGKGVKNKMDEWKYKRQLRQQGYDQ